MDRKLIGQYLVDAHKVTDRQVENALELQAMSLQGGNTPLIGTVLVAMGVTDEQEVTAALERQARDRQTSGELPSVNTGELPEVNRNKDGSTTL